MCEPAAKLFCMDVDSVKVNENAESKNKVINQFYDDCKKTTMTLNAWVRSLRKRFTNIEGLVMIKDNTDSHITQTILSDVQKNLGNTKNIRIFYKFSRHHPSVNQFDEDLGINLVSMNYHANRPEHLPPWFISKINGGLRTLAEKKGKIVPQAVCAKSNAVVAWSDSE